jgi:hypothetical protein
MIIALLIGILFVGGVETIFLTPDFKKNVKTYVKDKGKEKEILSLMDEAKKAQKDLLKQKGKITKKAALLSSTKSSRRDEIEKLFLTYYKLRLKAQETGIEREIKMKSIIEEPEWNNIIKRIDETTSKNKIGDYVKKTNAKIFDPLIKKCEKYIIDTPRREKIMAAIIAENEFINTFLDNFIQLNYKSMESIRAYSAGYNDYKVAIKPINTKRLEILHRTLDLRDIIIDNTTEEEWVKISKQIEDLIKNNSIAI